MTHAAENQCIAALDQSWAANVEAYGGMTVYERNELRAWLLGDRGPLRRAPKAILRQLAALACTGLAETSLRWARRHDDPL